MLLEIALKQVINLDHILFSFFDSDIISNVLHNEKINNYCYIVFLIRYLPSCFIFTGTLN